MQRKTIIQIAAAMLGAAAFSAFMAAIGYLVINIAWIGHAGLLLTVLLLTDVSLLIKTGKTFFALDDQPHSWYYDFRYERALIGEENISGATRLELEKKKHAGYIIAAGVFFLFFASYALILTGIVLLAYGCRRCVRHHRRIFRALEQPAMEALEKIQVEQEDTTVPKLKRVLDARKRGAMMAQTETGEKK